MSVICASLCSVGVSALLSLFQTVNESVVSLQGNTALMNASFYGYLPLAEALIQAKADVNNAHNVSSCSIPLFCRHKRLVKRKHKRLCVSVG